ncbi:Carbamoyl-phosphate synthase, partial [Coemansia sp. RSA 2673]
GVAAIKAAARGHAHADYVVHVAATEANAGAVAGLSGDAPILFVSFGGSDGAARVATYGAVAEHFKAWPARAAVATNARARGLGVTCDVSVFTLDSGSNGGEEAEALWSRLSAIDCFSVGAPSSAAAAAAGARYAQALPLLYAAVNKGRLRSADVVERLCAAPRRIFGLPEQPDTYVEVHRGRGVPGSVAVHRVVVRGRTLVLDGVFYGGEAEAEAAAGGRDLCEEMGAAKEGDVVVAAGEAEASPDKAVAADLIASSDKIVHLPSSTSLLADAFARHGGRNPFYMKHVLSVRQFSRDDLHLLFAVAHEMRAGVQRAGGVPLLAGRVMAAVFYEPSSRTA